MLDVLVFGSYAIAVLVIGRIASRRVENAEDFHLCGRKLSRLPAALSLAATEFSGSGLIGGAGLAYAIGLTGIIWNLAAVPAYIIIGFTIAVKLRKMALYTIPSYLGERYGIRTQRLVACLQILESVIFTAVQILVSAISLSTLFGMDMLTASVLVTGMFVAYTVMGGLWAVVWTDVLQYVILMSGILIAFPMAVHYAGGWHAVYHAIPAQRWNMGHLGIMEPLGWTALCFYSYATDQTYMQRAFACKDEKVARFAYVYTGLNYIVFAICVCGIGMVASILLPGLPQQDQALPALIHDVLPPGMRSFFLTAILATTMSTASSWLAGGSSLLIRDLYEPLIGRSAEDSDRYVLRDSRVGTFLLASAALVISLLFPGVVKLVVFSTIISPAAVFFALMLALYSRHTSSGAAFTSILVAAVTGVISQVWLYEQVPGVAGEIHPLLLGPALGLIVLGVPTWLSWRRQRAQELQEDKVSG